MFGKSSTGGGGCLGGQNNYYIIACPFTAALKKYKKTHQDVSHVRVDPVPLVPEPDVVQQGGLVQVHQAAVVVNIFLQHQSEKLVCFV